MRKSLIVLLTLCLAITSCEDKHNHLGNLNGNWQLTSWVRTNDGTLLADKQSGIYYSVSISLMKIWKVNDHGKYYMTTFRNANDSLIITQVHASPFDSIVPVSSLADYGVPDNGGFRIVQLNSTNMTLMGGDNTLTFRRY